MCGILLAVQRQENITADFEPLWDQLKMSNSARGPDAQETVYTSLRSDEGIPLDIRVFASELRLRGNKPIVQPHKDSGDAFCWNGEVFEGLKLDAFENDGLKLFEAIKGLHDLELELAGIFQSIEGPYAFCYFHEMSKKIYFGRDPLGRRSLLIHRPTTQRPYLIVASVSAGSSPLYELEEVGIEQLYCADLGDWNNQVDDAHQILHTLPRSQATDQLSTFAAPERVNRAIPDAPPLVTTLTSIPSTLAYEVDNLISQLGNSVKLMVQDVPDHGLRENGQARVAILFSGGIDCTVLAYLADQYIPLHEPIDLLNVAFENPRKIQVMTESSEGVKKKRKQSKTAALEPGQRDGKFDSYLVPDRITGLEELVELRKVCPRRRWQFIEVDVTFEETTKYRSIIEDVMYPCRTVMDLSLSLALYFASRGVGYLRTDGEGPKVPYTSVSRVLLNGLGSDELLGGYGRHRTAYLSGGWPAVVQELQLEIDRIPTRNLGRDDRIISSHGKEARHPFLSLSVVNFLAGLPVHHKTDPRLPLGLGDKMLLRLAARKVGLELASGRKKKAMQFGSHSARMEAGGSERKGDLLLNSKTEVWT